MPFKYYVSSRKVWMLICVLEIPILYLSGLSNRAPDSHWSVEAKEGIYKAAVLMFKKIDDDTNKQYKMKQDAILEAEQLPKFTQI